ncbi:hypothetical protein A0H81_00160 [Grifola frondosa]|uniref:QLQ domain-containing protein n=1 Tax=Grifola frondosa TaxID=5627 RepID=A0A1C7MT21_GRIFR|nr:hypothetical protein A0H81_00160 [Grifola frondosa]
MAATNLAPNPHQISQQHPFPNVAANGRQPIPPPNVTRDRIQACVQRAHFLRNNGLTPETSPELDRIYKFLHAFQQSQKPDQLAAEHPQPSLNGHTPPVINGAPPPNGNVAASTPTPAQPYPSASQTPVSFTPDQINALRAQIHAFKLLSRGMPIPEPIQQAIRIPNQAVPDLEKLLHGADVNARVVDSAVKIHKGTEESAVDGAVVDGIKAEEIEVVESTEDMPKGPFFEDDVNSGIYPYNAYMHPFAHLKREASTDPALFATRMQRLLVPSIMPAGLDPHEAIAERNRFVDARIDQRIASWRICRR